MDNDKTIREIVALFEQMKEKNQKCERILCSTCGGYGTAIRKKLTRDDHQKINDVLVRISPDEFRKFGVWTILLDKINHYGVLAIYKREAKLIDLSDVRAVDSFLFNRRWSYKDSPFEEDYLLILEHAIAMAVKTVDSSLVETLVIIFGEKMVKYPELLSIAIKLSKGDEEMQRVLYNCLRQSIPAVRGYVGAGITVDPSVQLWY